MPMKECSKTQHTKYKLNEVLEIIWDDAATTQGWHRPGCKSLMSNGGLSRSNTIGYFLRETKNAIQISKSYTEDGDRSDTQTIPIGVIRKVRRLK